MDTENKNHYDVLGVPADAGSREIRQAFLRLARKYQADLATFPAAGWYLERLNAAYEELADYETRCRYNAERGLPTPPTPEEPESISWLEGLTSLIPSNWYVYAFILVGLIYLLARILAWNSIQGNAGPSIP
jgi:curved DNA-binding protein CbpA